MATKIRLIRFGKKKQPFYRIVVIDESAARNSSYIEKVGLYNPIKENDYQLNEERILYWLGCGAQPTLTVRQLLKKQGILKKFTDAKVSAKKSKKEKKSE